MKKYDPKITSQQIEHKTMMLSAKESIEVCLEDVKNYFNFKEITGKVFFFPDASV